MYRLQEYGEIIFTDDLSRLLNTVKNRNFVLSGDVNINLLRQSEGVDNYNITMASNGLKSVINEPTRITDEHVSLIDHVFVRLRNIEYESCVIDSQITDHFVTVLCMKYTCINGTKKNSKGKVINYSILNKIIQQTDWTSVYIAQNVSLAFSEFLKEFDN